MIDRRSPSEKLLSHDATALESAAGGPIDLAIILGSGLSNAFRDAFPHKPIPYDKLLGFPVASLAGHAGEALVGTWNGKRVAAFAGRVHLYQGFSPQQVTVSVRLAHAVGANTLILTNAAGAINPAYAPGDLMLIRDHLNLTGRNPLIGLPGEQTFTDMVDAYSPRLRNLAKECASTANPVHEGVYAGVLGPSYETPAEAQYLRTIGADAAGMSTVLETILARTLGLGVLGISAITNIAGEPTDHSDVTALGGTAAPHLVQLLDALLKRL